MTVRSFHPLLARLLLVASIALTSSSAVNDPGCDCVPPPLKKNGLCLKTCSSGCKLEKMRCKKECSSGYAAFEGQCTVGYFDLSGLNASLGKDVVPFQSRSLTVELSGTSPVAGPFGGSDGIRLQPDGHINVRNLANLFILSGSNWVFDAWIKRKENVTIGDKFVVWEFALLGVIQGEVLLYCEDDVTSEFSFGLDCDLSLCRSLQLGKLKLGLDLKSHVFFLPAMWIRVSCIWFDNDLYIYINGSLVESLPIPPSLSFPSLTRFGTSSVGQNKTESIENVAEIRAFNSNGENHLSPTLFKSLFKCYSISTNLLCSRCYPGYYLLDGYCEGKCPSGYQPVNMTCEEANIENGNSRSYVTIASVSGAVFLVLLGTGFSVGCWKVQSKRKRKTTFSPTLDVENELYGLPNESVNPDYTSIDESDERNDQETQKKNEDSEYYYTLLEKIDYKWDRNILLSAKRRVYKEIDQAYSDYVEEKDLPFWSPAGTVKELTEQIEGRRIPKIEREKIELNKILGSGEFGTVESGQWRPRRNWNVGVAVKTLKSESEKDRVKFLREAALMSQFSHPNVVSLYGVVTDGDPMMIVLELMENGDLKNLLLKIKSESVEVSPVQVASLYTMSKEVALGMEYLATKSFIHRDLAARNIFLDHEFTCKIGDFGLARDLDNDYYVVSGGKIPVKWTAPEALSHRKYTTSSDVWSYGIVLYEIWSLGDPPYRGMTNGEVVSKVEQGFRLERPSDCPQCVYELMMECWNEDYHKRPSFEDITKILSENSECIQGTFKEEKVNHVEADCE